MTRVRMNWAGDVLRRLPPAGGDRQRIDAEQLGDTGASRSTGAAPGAG